MQSAYNIETEEKLRKDLKTSEEWKWKLNFPRKPNYDNMFYYNKSKNIFDTPCYYMDRDKPPDSYKRDFFHVKKELKYTEESLEKARLEAKLKKEYLAQQWRDLEKDEFKLRDEFVEFNKLQNENALKRKTAQKKLEEMNQMKEKNIDEISKITKKMEQIKKLIEQLKKNIQSHKTYEDYLKKVVMTGCFTSINEIINRYSALLEIKYNIAKDVEKTCEEFETKHSSYFKLVEEAVLIYLCLTKELSQLEKIYEEAKNKSIEWEKILSDICNKYSSTYQNVSCARIALEHLFETSSSRANREKVVVVKKKDDLNKLLSLNVTLKAMRRLEEQKQKLFRKRVIESSLDLEYRSFDIKDVVRKTMSKTVEDEKKDVKPEEAPNSPSGSTIQLTGTEKPDEAVCPIKLSRDKWKYANVKDFEVRYRKALMEIQEMKLKEQNRESIPESTPSSSQKRSRRSKWAVAAVAQKIAKDGANTDIQNFVTNVFSSTVTPKDANNTIIVFEDGFGSETDLEMRRMVPMIEKKFTGLLYRPRSKDTYDVEKGVSQLPPISSNLQRKLKKRSRPSTSVV